MKKKKKLTKSEYKTTMKLWNINKDYLSTKLEKICKTKKNKI